MAAGKLDMSILAGITFVVGAKIKFLNEKKAYTIQACNERFAVCTYPLNMIRRLGGGKYEHEKTVMYTIVDLEEGVRGPENLVFGMGAETREQCEDMLKRLTGEHPSEVTHRNRRSLDIECITIK